MKNEKERMDDLGVILEKPSFAVADVQVLRGLFDLVVLFVVFFRGDLWLCVAVEEGVKR